MYEDLEDEDPYMKVTQENMTPIEIEWEESEDIKYE